MKQIIFYIALIACTGEIYSQETQKRDEQQRPQKGFYKGIILMSGMTGSLADYSGTLFTNDKNIHDSLVREVQSKTTPLLFLGSIPASPLYLQKPKYINGHQNILDIEYGITSHIGIGISWMSTTMESIRQEKQLHFNLGPQKYYMEATPIHRLFYDERVMGFHASFHPLDVNRIDPYLIVRAGAGTMRTAHRKENDILTIYNNSSTGYSKMTGIGAGLNIMLTGEFGIKLEANHTMRILTSGDFSRESFRSTSLTAGAILNWENIDRYSY